MINQETILFIGGFLTAFFVTYVSIPSIIKVAELKHLYDEPTARKVHKLNIPTLGGVAIFAGFVFSISIWLNFQAIEYIQYILCAIIILFFIGIKDDIIAIDPWKKFGIEILAALILVYLGDIRLTSLYGILGIYELNSFFSILFSVFTIIVITNAFNLIDGIDTLTGIIGIIISFSFGILFYIMGEKQLSLLSVILIGALVAFLRYNITPAKVFMGDTGSLLVGLIASILAIKFIELNKYDLDYVHIKSAPAIAFGILIIPLFDTLRVFSIRLSRGRSPFYPDKNHLHHILVRKLGFSHIKAAITLGGVNLFFIGLVFLLQDLGAFWLIILQLILSILISLILNRLKIN